LSHTADLHSNLSAKTVANLISKNLYFDSMKWDHERSTG